MGKDLLRVGVVGASSLLAKELAEELAESEFGVVDVILLDEDVDGAQVTAVGDEASLIQQIDPAAFEGMDVCFFVGAAETTHKHWRTAIEAGTRVVDPTQVLAGQDGVVTRSPWIDPQEPPGTGATAVAPIHPVAAILGLVAGRCARLGLRSVAATLLEPASERGAAGVDEMHRQTVSLLSFQSVPRVEFDAQVAFNLLAELGPEAKVSIQSVARRIESDYLAAAAGTLAKLSLQMLHAPVFHGYGLSVLLDFAGDATAEAVEAALGGEHLEVVPVLAEEAPSNLNATGQGKVLVKVSQGGAGRVWLWMTADNLKLRALQAIACVAELRGIPATGRMQ